MGGIEGEGKGIEESERGIGIGIEESGRGHRKTTKE